jgi:hypothetical protein
MLDLPRAALAAETVGLTTPLLEAVINNVLARCIERRFSE